MKKKNVLAVVLAAADRTANADRIVNVSAIASPNANVGRSVNATSKIK